MSGCQGFTSTTNAPRFRTLEPVRSAAPAELLDESEEALPPGSVRLSILTTLAAGQEASAETALVAAFESKYPAIAVKRIGVPDVDLSRRVILLASTGDLPDVFAIKSEELPVYADIGLCADVGALLGADYLSGYDAILLTPYYVDGTLRAAPLFNSPRSLIYRLDLYEAEFGQGAAPPDTFDKLSDAARRLTLDRDNDGVKDQYGLAMAAYNGLDGYDTFFPMLRAYGAFELRQDSSGQWVSDIGGQASIDALKRFAEYVIRDGAVPPATLDTRRYEAIAQVADGTAAMIMESSGVMGEILALNPSLQGKLGIAPLPKSALRVLTADVYAVCVSADTLVRDEALDFIRFFHSADAFSPFASATGHMPVRMDTRAAFVVQPALKHMTEVSYDMLYEVPAHPLTPAVRRLVGTAWVDAMTGKHTPLQSVQAAEDAIGALLTGGAEDGDGE